MTVVGVVKDHKYRSIDEDPIPWPGTCTPRFGYMRNARRVARPWRTVAILPSARKVLQQIDPNLPLIEPMTQRAQYETTISQQLFFARLAGFFGSLAVVLVATGLYGTLAYRVNNRTVEIGVRMAVGAARTGGLDGVEGKSDSYCYWGGCRGAVGRVAGESIGRDVYGVTAHDALSYCSAVAGMVIVAVIASVLPARRAARVDPLSALR